MANKFLLWCFNKVWLAATQRRWCFPPMIRWMVHPEDARAFSCGVTAVCACLSCGRRWLCVGVGGVVRWWLLEEPCVSWEWEETGGGRKNERSKGEEERNLHTTNRPPLPPSSHPSTRPPTAGEIDPGGAVNGSGMESVCFEARQRGQPPDTTGSLGLPQLWSCWYKP